MKKYILILGIICPLLPIFLTCEKNPVSFSMDPVSEFSTEPKPHTILIDEENGYIYVANSNPSRQNDSHKIQSFDRKGNYQKTLVDFAADTSGFYDRYEPIDMTFDSDHHLDILVKPYRKYTDDSWTPYQGFCIMKYSLDGSFQAEFDFAQHELEWNPSAIAFHDESIFVTDGKVLFKINKDDGQSFEVQLPFNQEVIGPFISDMSIDSKGNIWMVGQAVLADTSIGCHITKVEPTCVSYKTFYSNRGTKYYGASLNNPGITIDKNDHIYLATFYCQSLEIFDRNGKFLNEIEIKNEDYGLPIDVAVDNQSNVFVADSYNDVVRIYKRH